MLPWRHTVNLIRVQSPRLRLVGASASAVVPPCMPEELFVKARSSVSLPASVRTVCKARIVIANAAVFRALSVQCAGSAAAIAALFALSIRPLLAPCIPIVGACDLDRPWRRHWSVSIATELAADRRRAASKIVVIACLASHLFRIGRLVRHRLVRPFRHSAVPPPPPQPKTNGASRPTKHRTPSMVFISRLQSQLNK